MFSNNNNDFQCKPENTKISSEHFQHWIFVVGVSVRMVHWLLLLCAVHSRTQPLNRDGAAARGELCSFSMLPQVMVEQ